MLVTKSAEGGCGGGAAMRHLGSLRGPWMDHRRRRPIVARGADVLLAARRRRRRNPRCRRRRTLAPPSPRYTIALFTQEPSPVCFSYPFSLPARPPPLTAGWAGSTSATAVSSQRYFAFENASSFRRAFKFRASLKFTALTRSTFPKTLFFFQLFKIFNLILDHRKYLEWNLA